MGVILKSMARFPANAYAITRGGEQVKLAVVDDRTMSQHCVVCVPDITPQLISCACTQKHNNAHMIEAHGEDVGLVLPTAHSLARESRYTITQCIYIEGGSTAVF